MQVERASKGMFLVALMLLASLSGCFGEDETIQEGVPIVFQIDYQMPSDVVLKSGEWHEFQLLGSGRAISVPNDVMLFVDGYIIPNGYAIVEGESINGKLLLTPYVDEVKLTIVHPDGTGTVYELDVTNGTPIVNGKEWRRKWNTSRVSVPIPHNAAATSTDGWAHRTPHSNVPLLSSKVILKAWAMKLTFSESLITVIPLNQRV